MSSSVGDWVLPLHTVERGSGPELVLVHGSATDSDGFVSVYAHGARAGLRLVSYDRRGTPRSPLPPGTQTWSVEDHARDLAAFLRARPGPPRFVYGSSFGAVVVLEMARSCPDACAGIILAEPPLPSGDGAPPVPARFIDELHSIRATNPGPAEGHFFLQEILSELEYQRMPPLWRDRAASFHESIWMECKALMEYEPRYAELKDWTLRTLLLGGQRSGPDFPPALDALERHLPGARRVSIPGAGHLVHADQPRRFLHQVQAFMADSQA